MQLSSFNLYTLGTYTRFDGEAVNLISMALHSETGEIYAVLSDDVADEESTTYYVELLSLFGDPDYQGKGPRYTLKNSWEITDGFSCADGIETGVYGHYKSDAHGGREYDVFGTVTSDDGEFVLYRPCYGTRPMMIRPLDMFTEEVDAPDYNYKGPRFYKLRDF